MSYELGSMTLQPSWRRRPRRVLRRFPVRRARFETGLGKFSWKRLKPPKIIRKAVAAVVKKVAPVVAVVASGAIPGAGFITGSRKAPRFLRAPGSVRPLIRTLAKVQLASAAVIGGGLVAAPLLATAGPGLVTLGKRLMRGAGGAVGPSYETPGISPDLGPTQEAAPQFSASPSFAAGPEGGGGGGGGEEPGAPDQTGLRTALEAAPTGMLIIGALVLGALALGVTRKLRR